MQPAQQRISFASEMPVDVAACMAVRQTRYDALRKAKTGAMCWRDRVASGLADAVGSREGRNANPKRDRCTSVAEAI